MDQARIGRFIAERRKALGLTQRQLAERLAVSDKAVSKWETGRGLPDVLLMPPLCAALGITVNDLLSGERVGEGDYRKKAEENMMELMRENAENRQRLLQSIACGGVTVVAVCALVALAGASIKRLRYAGLFLMFVALIGVVVGSSYLSSTAASAEMFIDFARGFSDLFARVYPLAGLYEKAVLGGDILSLIAYVGLSLLAILLAGALFGHFFVRINSFLTAQTRKKRFVLGAQKRHSARAALLAREWRHFLSINSYVLNSAFGPILSLVAVVALAVLVPKATIDMFLQLEGLDDIALSALPFALSWLISIGPTTACSVSLEGKNLWIVKTLPIPARDWLLPKLRLNLQLFTPFAILDSLVVAWIFRASGVALAVLVLMPALMGAFSALIGLIVNCKFPRFDWTNAAKVAKNSAGVVAAVFISMALCFGGLLLTIKLPAPAPMLLPAIFTIALAIACAALYLLVRARAEKWAAAMH